MGRAGTTLLTDLSLHARLASNPQFALAEEVSMVDEMAAEVADGVARPDVSLLIAVHERQLYRRALGFCRNADEARDLVQDTLVRALKHVAGLRPDSNIRGWLITIMVNLYRDRLKRQRRSREVAFESWHDVANIADEVPQPPGRPVLEREQVEAAMAKLSPEQRGLLQMKAVDGLRYRDIGERLGIPPNTVGTRLRQARKALTEILEKAEVDD